MIKCQRMWTIDSLKLLLLFASFNLIISQHTKIRNPCRHNEFRCTDGSSCLRTELLCNGRRDCSNGEDERGGGRWNCRKLTLASDYCDPASQFRCRFGGCINRISLCNGQPDCWGGSDEATDVCRNEKVVIPQLSGGSSSSPQRPHQIQQVAPTTPPRATSRPPPPIQTSNREQFPSAGGFGACGKLVEDPTKGFKVICENSRFYEVDCGDSPEGGQAHYQCERHFTAISQLIRTATRRCQNGRWTPLNNNFGCEPDCGISGADTGAFIVGGSTAKAGRWPWMVAIYERNARNPNKFDIICGASLISSKAIITAAHCVVRRDSGELKRFSDLKIVMGKYYRTYGKQSTGEQERAIENVFKHPEYNRITLNNDIAIIKLSQPVIITDIVRPVCLPGHRDDIENNELGTLVGWGRGDGKGFQEQLQQANLPMVSAKKCVEAHPQFAHLVHQGTFCAGYTNGTSACDGDSGGPLVFRDRYRQGKWILHGVVSAGIASSDRTGCNPNYYTVFTNVGYGPIRRWVDNTLNSYFNNQ